MRPRLSIITPSFNQADFIERTLKSVLEQGYPDLEYIVVDGGSDDGSVEIIERYSDQLAWWVSEPDEGQTHALNKGLARATGEIVAYINSDDYYLPGAFETAVAGFEDPQVQWLAGTCLYLDGGSGEEPSIWTPQPPDPRRYWWMLQPWGVPQAATFWRRDVFARFGTFRQDMHYVFDTELGLRLAYAGVLPRLTEEKLAVRFLQGEAKSTDLEPFDREARRFVELFAPALSRWERFQLHRTRLLLKVGWYGVRLRLARSKRRLMGKPEPIPPIRRLTDRD